MCVQVTLDLREFDLRDRKNIIINQIYAICSILPNLMDENPLQ